VHLNLQVAPRIEGDRPGSNLTYVEAPNRLDELGIEIRQW
jgi:hypothetical protein